MREGIKHAVHLITPAEALGIGKTLRQTFSVGRTKPNTKIHVFLYTEERIVRQHKRPSLHAFSAEIEQRNLGRYKRFSGFQFLCQLFRKLRPRRSFLLRQVLPRTASQGRNQLAERAGHGKHIGQAGIGDIHVRNSLKENLTGVFPGFPAQSVSYRPAHKRRECFP